MKIGRDPLADPRRVEAARQAIGPHVELFVDANGAYSRKQALAQAEAIAEQAVTWFEEPVSSDDLDGLRLVRDRAPASMEIAAGEYGYDLPYFRRMLEAGAVDVLQVAVIIDFSKYMHRIFDLDPEQKLARVQPGVVLDWLRDAVEKHRLTFPPDPSTHAHCTLGGMIGGVLVFGAAAAWAVGQDKSSSRRSTT